VRYWLISHSQEALDGMELAGVHGELVTDAAQAEAAVARACGDETVAVLLVTTTVSQWISDTVARHKLSGHQPLMAVIPGPEGGGLGEDSITERIRQAIGVKI
jgi:V/A-type H+-transporting ATPase subunit F